MHKYWNQGYTTEAAKAILEFAHLKLGECEFIACHAIENTASGRVMEKCGFKYENNEVHTKFDGITSYETKRYKLVL
jgi:ribosomal-protein-alanine N-acetyltransferase